MARTRTYDNRQLTETAAVETFRGGPPPYSAGRTVISTDCYQGEVSTITDEVTPQFRKRMRNGEIIMNSMSLSRGSRTPCPISFRAGPWPTWYNGGYEQYSGDWGKVLEGAVSVSGKTPSVQDDLGRMCDIALVKAYEAMNSSPLLTGESLSDFSRTLSMLRRPFSSATSLLMRISRRRQRLLRATRNAAEASSNAWLEYRYGWKPLLMDCDEAVQQVMQFRKKLFTERRIARGRESLSQDKSNDFDVSLYGSFRAKGTVVLSCKRTASAGVLYEVLPQSTHEQLVGILGLRPRDLVPTLWEIVPYSFVMDWFVNVGSWLQAVTPNSSLVVKRNWVTTVDRRVMSYNAGQLSYVWNGTFTGSYPGFQTKSDSVVRTPDRVLTLTPSITVRPLSSNQTVDALALTCKQLVTSLGSMRH